MSECKYLYYIETEDQIILWPNNHMKNMIVYEMVSFENYYDAVYIGEL